ncbi:MAG: hypothetical protein EBT48_00780 [Verrucomicrobia bacterium]|jgi:hypothetical protein|nr:hypothetical protein [Verrucomicrobiota bacterium]
MYHKSADQLSSEKIIIPNPDVVTTARAAKKLVAEFGTLEKIENYLNAHLACGKYIETLDDAKQQDEVANTLGVMQVLESLISQAVVGADKITIIKFK